MMVSFHGRLWCSCTMLLAAACGFAEMARAAAYPQSNYITGVWFNDSSIRTEAPGSDNWPITWAANDKLYTTWGDGGGFGGTNDFGRVSLGVGRVEGNKNNYYGVNIAGGANNSNPAPFEGKSEGILALDNRLYMWRAGWASDDSAFDFSQLWRSDNLGASWNFTGVEFTRLGNSPDFSYPDNGFFSPAFAQYGRGYADARDNYVYMYAPEVIDVGHWNVQKPGRISLTRVHRNNIENKWAYEFFAGLNAQDEPMWTNNISYREPVWEDTIGGAHRNAVSYNAPLNRYFLTTMNEDRDGRIGIYEAPNPWGPWSTVLVEENSWRWGSKVVVFTFVNKWLSGDGRDFVIAYTRNDSWATIEGHFSVNPTVLLTGDANNDIRVTGQDLIVAQERFGSVEAGEPTGLMLGDANDDGVVTGLDLVTVQRNFGSSLAPGEATVPEPSTMAVAGLGMALRSRRVRPR